MNNSLVSARVPMAKREAAKGALTAIGATTSDLINSAFDYVIAVRDLPRAEKAPGRSRESFARFIGESSLEIPWGSDADDGDYRALIASGKRADYESLA